MKTSLRCILVAASSLFGHICRGVTNMLAGAHTDGIERVTDASALGASQPFNMLANLYDSLLDEEKGNSEVSFPKKS